MSRFRRPRLGLPALFCLALAGAAAGVAGCQYGFTPILADDAGIGELCETDDDCPESTVFGRKVRLICLTDLAGGYCALGDCTTGLECPSGSICIAHDSKNVCVRSCNSDEDCNANRASHDARCTRDFEYAHESAGPEGFDACLPPSGQK